MMMIFRLAGADRSQNHRIKLDYLQVTSGVGVRSVAVWIEYCR